MAEKRKLSEEEIDFTRDLEKFVKVRDVRNYITDLKTTIETMTELNRRLKSDIKGYELEIFNLKRELEHYKQHHDRKHRAIDL